MRSRTAALVLSGSLVGGFMGAVALTPASAESSTNPVSSRLGALKSALAGLVTDGTLTQAQADKVATTLDAKLPQRGPGGPGGFGRPDGPGRHGHGLRAEEAAAAAKALGLTEAELRTKLQSGSSLAQIAGAQKVPVDTLVKALVEVAKTHLAADVTAGRLTQAQADSMAADLTQRITDRVNRTRPAHGPDVDGTPPPAPEQQG